jgi:hypothetical protein
MKGVLMAATAAQTTPFHKNERLTSIQSSKVLAHQSLSSGTTFLQGSKN